LCGHELSASSISSVVARLDEQLDEVATRLLEQDSPYLILDARYERVREGGVVRSLAVLVAIGITWDER
jgi:transposase-like protein